MTEDWWIEQRLSPLHMGAYAGDLAEVVRCLDAGASPDSGDKYGRTPLWWACFKSGSAVQYVGIVKALLQAGADPSASDADAGPALVVACQAGNSNVASQLLEAGAEVNLTWGNLPPLVAAAQVGSAETVRVLLEFGADPSAIGPFGMTALEWAESSGFEEAAELLRSKF